jgi:UDPglucose 6-dehydrogenase
LVTGACLAEVGHDVIRTDVDAERIAQLQSGGVPIYQHRLAEVLESRSKSGKISTPLTPVKRFAPATPSSFA